MGMVDWWAPTAEEPILKISSLSAAAAKFATEGEQNTDVNASTEHMEDSGVVPGADQMAVEQGSLVCFELLLLFEVLTCKLDKAEEGEENELIDGANDAHSDAGGVQDN